MIPKQRDWRFREAGRMSRPGRHTKRDYKPRAHATSPIAYLSHLDIAADAVKSFDERPSMQTVGVLGCKQHLVHQLDLHGRAVITTHTVMRANQYASNNSAGWYFDSAQLACKRLFVSMRMLQFAHTEYSTARGENFESVTIIIKILVIAEIVTSNDQVPSDARAAVAAMTSASPAVAIPWVQSRTAAKAIKRIGRCALQNCKAPLRLVMIFTIAQYPAARQTSWTCGDSLCHGVGH